MKNFQMDLFSGIITSKNILQQNNWYMHDGRCGRLAAYRDIWLASNRRATDMYVGNNPTDICTVAVIKDNTDGCFASR